jgi:hypothetical protein
MNRPSDLGTLIEANRTATAPSAEIRERNRGNLTARIGSGIAIGSALFNARDAGAGASAGNGASASVSSAAAGGLAKWLAVSALLTIGGGVGVHSVRHHLGAGATVALPSPPSAVAALRPLASAAVTAPEVTPAADAPGRPASRVREKSASNMHGARPNTPLGSVGRDRRFDRALELLRSARRSLDDGLPSPALTLLDRYAVEFPRGSALQAEYEATRVFALCAAGLGEAAERAKDHFLESQPGSPLAGRLRTACGAR